MNPGTAANCEAIPVRERLYSGQLYRSLNRATSRSIMMPKVFSCSDGYRSWLSGIRNSAVQPSESMRVATSQTPSQDSSSSPSLYV